MGFLGNTQVFNSFLTSIRLFSPCPPRLTHLSLSHIDRYCGGGSHMENFPLSCLKNTLKSLCLHESEFDEKFLHDHILQCKKLESLDISQVPSESQTVRYEEHDFRRPVRKNKAQKFFDCDFPKFLGC